MFSKLNPAMIIEPTQELITSRSVLSLDGEWAFSYDPGSIGEKEGWFKPDATLPETTMVPGCDQAAKHASAGISEADFCQSYHKSLKYPCDASAWHRKRFVIPADWRDREVWLHFGGINPAAEIWFNGEKIGGTLSSRCPIRCNLTPLARFGAENTVVVRTYWPKGARMDGLFETYSAFSGLYRSVRAEAVPSMHIKELHVLGRISPPSAVVNFTVAGLSSRGRRLQATCNILDARGEIVFSGEVTVQAGEQNTGTYSITLDMPKARLWGIESPYLYQAVISLVDGDRPVDSVAARFGLREIRCDDLHVLFNGKPVFLRGGCDDQSYPATICPPASKEFYVERLKRARKYGFNYTKSCMEIFTQEFLDAADEVGMLVCQEMPFGLSGEFHKSVYTNMPEANKALYRQELRNIMRSDRNHPSVVLYSMASEFYTSKLADDTYKLFCQELPAAARALNTAALVMDITCTGSTSVPGGWTGNEKRGPRDTDMIEDVIPDQERQEPLRHPIPGRYDELNRPFIIHEYNWWTSLSDPALKSRYDQIPTKPTGIPELEAGAAKISVAAQLPKMVENSRKLKYLLQKCGLEVARRNPRISGYHFWLVAGLSWCQEGVFNEFFDEPRDLSAEEVRTFNDDTVLLLDDGNRRVFECGAQVSLGIEVSHYGLGRMAEPRLRWRLKKDAATIMEGEGALKPIECGAVTAPHKLNLKMPAGPLPATMKLRVALFDGNREICHNAWTLWAVPSPKGGERVCRVATDLPFLAKAYPDMIALDESRLTGRPVIVTAHMSPALIACLGQGGRIVLLSDRVLKDYGPDVEWCPQGKSSKGQTHQNNDLYRTVPYNRDSHGNMGTVIADHPALGGMPHEGWCDLNFLYLISGAYPILLEHFHPHRIDPIIRSIGHQKTMVDKAYLFEMRVGKGALLATSLKVAATYVSHPESRYLLDCLMTYAAGDAFAPKHAVTKDVLISALPARAAKAAREDRKGIELRSLAK